MPQGNGTLTKAGGRPNVHNGIRMDLGNGAQLHVIVEVASFERDIDVCLGIDVPENQWVQLTSDIITLLDTENHQSRTCRIEHWDSDVRTGHGYGSYSALDKLEGEPKHTSQFYILHMVKEFRPSQFELRIPAIVVTGRAVNIAPIKFTLHHGVVFYDQIM